MSKKIKIPTGGYPSKQEMAAALEGHAVIGIPERVLDSESDGWCILAEVEEKKPKAALKQVAKPKAAAKPKAPAKKPSLGKKKDSE